MYKLDWMGGVKTVFQKAEKRSAANFSPVDILYYRVDFYHVIMLLYVRFCVGIVR
jgi:hypothetical protein